MSFLTRAWYKKSPWLWLLWPLALAYQLLATLRRSRQSKAAPDKPPVPLIVVGNITVGGTGKTPCLISLCEHLLKQGFKPGVISRGYGGQANTYPMFVTPATSPLQAGDEPVLIASRTGRPVVVDPDRMSALNALLEKHQIDVVLSDDGLQHYRLPRTIEIAVVDGQRLFGNELCLPAGPLREPVSRLQEVDFVVLNGDAAREHAAVKSAHAMRMKPKRLVNLASGEKRPFGGAPFNMGSKLQAFAAIGNPQRFFDSLRSLPYPVEEFVFPDHHQFTISDFESQRLVRIQPLGFEI